MYDQNVSLLEMPKYKSISVCVYIEQDGILQLGERIEKQFEAAYMNGYNWDALISYYVAKQDPELAAEVNSDPEAGMYSAFMSYSPENLVKMKKFEAYIRELLAEEATLFNFIKEHYSDIEWD